MAVFSTIGVLSLFLSILVFGYYHARLVLRLFYRSNLLSNPGAQNGLINNLGEFLFGSFYPEIKHQWYISLVCCIGSFILVELLWSFDEGRAPTCLICPSSELRLLRRT